MNQLTSGIVVPTALLESFTINLQKCRVIYFCGPCGIGKTAVAHELLNGYKVRVYSAYEPDFQLAAECPDCDVVLIDDFQAVEASADQQTICRWINENPDKCFVFLSRGILPGWLMPYQFTALLTVIDFRALLLDLGAVEKLLSASGAETADARSILRDTDGYPLLIAMVCSHMADGSAYTRALLEECHRELFHYYEDAVYRRFSPPMRSLLVALAPFDDFDPELAKMVSGDSHVNVLLSDILHKTTMLRENSVNAYRFQPLFRSFLLWEMQQDCTVEQQNNIYRRAGLYYELHDDYTRALDCYSQSGDHGRLSELLEKNAEKQVGAAHYYDMERYYLALPEEDVLRSPALMTGMSILTAICADF